MQRTYCLPLRKTSKQEILASIEQATNYDYFELWADYVEDIDYGFVSDLAKKYGARLILVFRRSNLETPVMETQKRLSIISSLQNTGCLLDLDVVTQQEELSYIANNSLKIDLITSYHNSHETPDTETLVGMISLMTNYNPKLMKLATYCNTQKDALRLLELLSSLKEDQRKFVILGLGSLSTIVTIYGSLWKNEMIIAPLEKADAIDGQLTRNELETIFNLIQQQ